MPKPPNLDKVWAAWCAVVADQPADDPLPLHDRLARFGPRSTTADHVATVRDVLFRGVPLLLAAVGWAEPTAGSRGAKSRQTDRARGDQWRLAMAYGGFETLARGLLAAPDRTHLEPADFDALLARCKLPRFAPIPRPELKDAVREAWLGPDMQAAPRHPLLAFLGLHNGDAEVVYRWLAEGQPIATWGDALRLAQALRNVTAHGALSASKSREWKLRPAFARLTHDLATVAAAALKALVQPTVDGMSVAAAGLVQSPK